MDSSDTTHLEDIKVTLAVVVEKLDNVDKHVEQLNGKSIANADRIAELQESKVAIESSFLSAKWVAGIAIGFIVALITTISTLAVYAYQNDRETLKDQTDQVAKQLVTYQSTMDVNTKQIIELLKALQIKK